MHPCRAFEWNQRKPESRGDLDALINPRGGGEIHISLKYTWRQPTRVPITFYVDKKLTEPIRLPRATK